MTGAIFISDDVVEQIVFNAIINIIADIVLDTVVIKQGHLRMNNSTGSNNHLRSIDLFRSMII